MDQEQINELLQALRNVTREHMLLLADIRDVTIDETRDVLCISTALYLLDKHQYKTNNPL